MTDEIGPGTLKLIVASSPEAAAAAESAVRARVRGADVRRLGDALLAYTDARPDELRDAIRDSLPDGESVLVVEFERWSSAGGAVDTEWLLRRGH